MPVDDCLICVGAGNSQIPFIKKAKEMGYCVIAIDKNPEAQGFAYADECIKISTYETQKVIMRLFPLRSKYHFAGIIPHASGPALQTASSIAEKFFLAGLSEQIVRIATVKSNLREFCEKNGLNMARGQKVKAFEEIDSTLGFPLIVKPDFPIIGKKNVRIVSKKADLNASIRRACQSSENGCAEVERFIKGFDAVSLFLLRNGKAKILAFVDELVGINQDGMITGLGGNVPSVIMGTDVENKIRKIVSQFAAHFVKTNALLLMCFRIDMVSNTPYIIEVHADLGGDLFLNLMSPKAAKNFDYFEIAIKISSNQEIPGGKFIFEPLCLLYNYNYENYGKRILSDFELFHEYVAVQRGTVFENICRANQLMDNQMELFAYLPFHKQWMEK